MFPSIRSEPPRAYQRIVVQHDIAWQCRAVAHPNVSGMAGLAQGYRPHCGHGVTRSLAAALFHSATLA